MSEEEKDFALRKNIIIGIIIIVVTYGIYSTPVLAIFNNVEIIISNEFLNALVSISTSFFSIFAIIMFFVYPEIKKNLETVENKTIEMPKKYDDTGLVNDPIMYQRFLDEKSNRVKKLRKQRNQIMRIPNNICFSLTKKPPHQTFTQTTKNTPLPPQNSIQTLKNKHQNP